MKPPLLYCPLCHAGSVTVLSVADDYRSVTVKCETCLKECASRFPRSAAVDAAT